MLKVYYYGYVLLHISPIFLEFSTTGMLFISLKTYKVGGEKGVMPPRFQSGGATTPSAPPFPTPM